MNNLLEHDKISVTPTFQIPLPAKNPRTTIVIPPDLKAEFEELCEKESRSFSNYVVHLIKQTVEAAKREGKLGDRTKSKTHE